MLNSEKNFLEIGLGFYQKFYFLNFFQLHPAHLIFDILSEFEVKIDHKHDFDLFFAKSEQIVFFRKFQFFCEKEL